MASKRKPFTHGEFIMESFIKSAELLFSELPNKEKILSHIQEMLACFKIYNNKVKHIMVKLI